MSDVIPVATGEKFYCPTCLGSMQFEPLKPGEARALLQERKAGATTSKVRVRLRCTGCQAASKLLSPYEVGYLSRTGVLPPLTGGVCSDYTPRSAEGPQLCATCGLPRYAHQREAT